MYCTRSLQALQRYQDSLEALERIKAAPRKISSSAFTDSSFFMNDVPSWPHL